MGYSWGSSFNLSDNTNPNFICLQLYLTPHALHITTRVNPLTSSRMVSLIIRGYFVGAVCPTRTILSLNHCNVALLDRRYESKEAR